jgi:thiamine-phosphate pyrophosphorylase
MELIVISKPTAVKDEEVILNQLFECGLTIFHLRKPNWSKGSYEKLLNKINPDYLSRIALHQHHDLALDYNINRIHFPEHLRKLMTANSNQLYENLMLEKKVLSTSIHDLSSLNKLNNFDYTFYGPVFNSISKRDYQGVVPDNFRLRKTNLKTKIIALGGIDKSNIGLVKRMNFDGVALLGSIWEEPMKAVETFKKLAEDMLMKGSVKHKIPC